MPSFFTTVACKPNASIAVGTVTAQLFSFIGEGKAWLIFVLSEQPSFNHKLSDGFES